MCVKIRCAQQVFIGMEAYGCQARAAAGRQRLRVRWQWCVRHKESVAAGARACVRACACAAEK